MTFLRKKPTSIKLPIVVLIVQQGDAHFPGGKAIVSNGKIMFRYLKFRDYYPKETLVVREGRSVIIKLKADNASLVADARYGNGYGIRELLFSTKWKVFVFHEYGIHIVRIVRLVGLGNHSVSLCLSE